jgi:hypothetical protein
MDGWMMDGTTEDHWSGRNEFGLPLPECLSPCLYEPCPFPLLSPARQLTTEVKTKNNQGDVRGSNPKTRNFFCNTTFFIIFFFLFFVSSRVFCLHFISRQQYTSSGSRSCKSDKHTVARFGRVDKPTVRAAFRFRIEVPTSPKLGQK